MCVCASELYICVCAYVAGMLLVVVDGLGGGGGMCLCLYTLVGMMHDDCV